jgi:hypothetical protein
MILRTPIPAIASGDVIELDTPAGPRTALVLLASGGSLILDLLDGQVPQTVREDELTGVRRFDPEHLSDLAA